MERCDLYSDIATQTGIDNDLWIPIFESKYTCEVNRISYMIFEIFQSSSDKLYISKYHVSLSYNESTYRGSVKLHYFSGDTAPLEMCYVIDETNDTIIFYSKPKEQGKSICLKILNSNLLM